MSDEKAPPAPSALACWIYDHQVRAVRVDYRMTSEDTAETWLVLTGFENAAGKVPTTECRPAEFHVVAELRLSHATCAELRRGQREAIEAYRAFIKQNQRELAEYRRLRRKFGETLDAR